MIAVRIICKYCGENNYCGIPIGELTTVKIYKCGSCDGHLFDLEDVRHLD